MSLLTLFIAASLPAQQPAATFMIKSSAAEPGEIVALPFSINANLLIEAFSVSLDFDEEVLEAVHITRVYERPDGEDWFFYRTATNNFNETPGSHGVDEGYLVIAGVIILRGPNGWDMTQLPRPDFDHEMLQLNFLVKSSAPAGVTELRFVNGGKSIPTAPGLSNICTLTGQSTVPQFQVNPVMIGGQVNITRRKPLFVRGDSNYDGRVDISDAIATLGYLFLGEMESRCLDAADANDDGQIDISDPIITLQALFLGTVQFPLPNPSPGEDPTIDSLDCQVDGQG